MRNYKNGKLPWHGDLDNDGNAELIIWESFNLYEGAIAHPGLIAWVYRYTAKHTFTIDWNLSRRMAREIADAYRRPIHPRNARYENIRIKLASAIEKFANDQCSLNSGANP